MFELGAAPSIFPFRRYFLTDKNGTGPLVFEFVRIKAILDRNQQAHYFWLFENVASMKPEWMNIIARYVYTIAD